MMNMKPTASHIEKVEFPKEVHDLATLLEVIQNKDKVTAFLKAIDEHAAKANLLIEKVGKAEQIGKLFESAKAKEEKATEILNEVNQKAAEILAAAENKALLLTSNAESNADKLLSEAEAARAQAIQDATAAKESKMFAEKALESATAKFQEVESKQSRLDKELAEIDRKKTLLAQL